MEPKGVSVSFNLKTPKNEHYKATITNLSSLDCIVWVRRKLTTRQLQMFRETCLGYLLDMQELTFPSKLVHNVLLWEVETTNLSKQMWFLLQGRTIRFSAYEFGLVTGLKFGQTPHVPETTACRLRDTYFDGKNLQLRFFYEALEKLDLSVIPDEDVVKLAMYYVLERFLLASERRRLISVKWMNFTDNLAGFNDYPWGTESFHMTITSMKGALRNRLKAYKKRLKDKKGDHESEKYNLKGCPYAIQVWLYEAVPLIGSTYGEVSEDFTARIPRILKWRTTRNPHHDEVKKFVSQIRRIDRPLVILEPTNVEVATEWHQILLKSEGMERGEHVIRAMNEVLTLRKDEIIKEPSQMKTHIKGKKGQQKPIKGKKSITPPPTVPIEVSTSIAEGVPGASEGAHDSDRDAYCPDIPTPPQHSTVPHPTPTSHDHPPGMEDFMCNTTLLLGLLRNEVIGLREDYKGMQSEIDGMKKFMESEIGRLKNAVEVLTERFGMHDKEPFVDCKGLECEKQKMAVKNEKIVDLETGSEFNAQNGTLCDLISLLKFSFRDLDFATVESILTARQAKLNLEMEKSDKANEWLKERLDSAGQEKLALEEKMKKYQIKCRELQHLNSQLSQETKSFCVKGGEAESEVEIWKRKYVQLESRTLKLEEDTKLLSVEANVRVSAENSNYVKLENGLWSGSQASDGGEKPPSRRILEIVDSDDDHTIEQILTENKMTSPRVPDGAHSDQAAVQSETVTLKRKLNSFKNVSENKRSCNHGGSVKNVVDNSQTDDYNEENLQILIHEYHGSPNNHSTEVAVSPKSNYVEKFCTPSCKDPVILRRCEDKKGVEQISQNFGKVVSVDLPVACDIEDSSSSSSSSSESVSFIETDISRLLGNPDVTQ